MNDFNTIVALLGGATLFLGLGSRWLARTPLPPSLLALLLGILTGPQVFGLIDLEATGQRADIMEKAARLTLGISLMGVVLRVPRDYPRTSWRQMLLLIGLGMLIMWVISAALVYRKRCADPTYLT